MKKFHRICETIFVFALFNFLLVIFSIMILGGSGAYGKVEEGHYFLGYRGDYREVHPVIYWFSYYHAYSLMVTHPLAMLTGVLYAITGGGRFSPTTTVYLVPRSKNKFWASAWRVYWKVVDFIEEIIWTGLDRWRKPQEEWFVHLSRKDCVQLLRHLNKYGLSAGAFEMPILCVFSGNHFSLQKRNENIFVRDGGLRPIVKGRFTRTPQGTVVRIWHRFTTHGIVFITVFFGTALSVLTLYGIGQTPFIRNLEINLPEVITLSALVIFPLFYTSIFLLSLLIGDQLGQINNEDIVCCIQSMLGEAREGKM